jgi:hypothetical protein
LALAHLADGCNRPAAIRALAGRRVFANTIQEILNDHGLGKRYDRWLALRRANAEQAIALSGERVAFLEKLNPCFGERQVESQAPGGLLCTCLAKCT